MSTTTISASSEARALTATEEESRNNRASGNNEETELVRVVGEIDHIDLSKTAKSTLEKFSKTIKLPIDVVFYDAKIREENKFQRNVQVIRIYFLML